jgi:hypothetical protein
LHSDALIMKDISDMNPVASAVKTLDAVLERFSDDDLRKRLTALQIAAAPAGAAPTTLRLLKPVSTRIGVKYFCLQRIVKMKPFISTIMPEITAPQWTSVENSVKALEPFAEAFFACERDDATLWTVCRQFRKLEQSIHDFEHVDGLKNFARLVKPILGGRWARQFDSDGVRALRLLDPQRQEDVSPVDKMSTLQWLKKLGNELHKFKHGSDAGVYYQDTITAELGALCAKEDAFGMVDYSKPFWQFWKQSRLVAPALGTLVLDVAEARPSEAAVERCFSKHGAVLRPKRNRLGGDTAHAILTIAFSYHLLYEWTESEHKVTEEVE